MTEQKNKNIVDDEKTLPTEPSVVLENKSTAKTDTETIKELLEKNLKWSQIIYEQNRKINNKLMWSAISSWFRILLIVVPLIFAIWFLPPIIQGLQSTYGGLLGGGITSGKPNSNSIDQLLKMLPLDQAKQEQLKALLK